MLRSKGAMAWTGRRLASSQAASEAEIDKRVKNESFVDRSNNSLIKRLIHVRRVSQTTTRGKMRQLYAMVIVGNGNGMAGYGEGKSADSATAVDKAARQAVKNMKNIARLDKRTVFSDMDHTFFKTRLKIWTAPPGYGIVASERVHEVCRCFGIKDIGVKILGSRNPMNVVKATFDALLNAKTPEQIAQMRGKKVTDVVATYYGENPSKE